MDRKIRVLLGFVGVIVVAQLVAPQPALAGCIPNTLTIEVDGCPEPDTEFVARIVLTNATESICAGQFFLEYSTSVFDLLTVAAGEYPFLMPLFSSDEPELGHIDYAVGAWPLPCTSQDSLMAVVTFRARASADEPFIRFRDSHVPTLLTGMNGGILPHSVDAGVGEAVSLADVARFQNCFDGEGVAVAWECACPFDDNGDGDIDLADFQALQTRMNGPVRLVCKDP